MSTISFPYWIFPLISAGMWFATLLTMLIHWCRVGHPHYPSFSSGQSIAYISDVGAFGLKPLFITSAVITTTFLDLAFVSERWLRHTGVLSHNTTAAEKVLSSLSIVFALFGTAGLILLSIFDTYRHPHLHDGFLLLFLGGFVASASCTCAEYQRLGIHFRQHRVLRASFWVKLSFILIETGLGAVFVACKFDHRPNVSAVFEWMVAFAFTFYVLSFLLDLLPSVRTKHHIPQGLADELMGREMEQKTSPSSQGQGRSQLGADPASLERGLEHGEKDTAPAAAAAWTVSSRGKNGLVREGATEVIGNEDELPSGKDLLG